MFLSRRRANLQLDPSQERFRFCKIVPNMTPHRYHFQTRALTGVISKHDLSLEPFPIATSRWNLFPTRPLTGAISKHKRSEEYFQIQPLTIRGTCMLVSNKFPKHDHSQEPFSKTTPHRGLFQPRPHRSRFRHSSCFQIRHITGANSKTRPLTLRGTCVLVSNKG